MTDSFDPRTDQPHGLPEESFWCDEAMKSRPEFSLSLHERIMDELMVEHGNCQVAQPDDSVRGFRHWLLPGSAVTVLTAAVILFLLYWGNEPPTSDRFKGAEGKGTSGALAAKSAKDRTPAVEAEPDGIAWLSQILQTASVAVQATPFRAPEDMALRVDAAPQQPAEEKADRRDWEATVLAEQDRIVVQLDEDAIRSLADAFFSGG